MGTRVSDLRHGASPQLEIEMSLGCWIDGPPRLPSSLAAVGMCRDFCRCENWEVSKERETGRTRLSICGADSFPLSQL